MDTEFPPPRPIDIEISSDTEPVKCIGAYRAAPQGFVLEFDIGQDRYTVEHTDARTVFCCVGKNQSYTLTLCDKETQMRLDTVYGALDYAVVTETRKVEYADNGINMELGYNLIADGEVVAARNIRLKGNLRTE